MYYSYLPHIETTQIAPKCQHRICAASVREAWVREEVIGCHVIALLHPINTAVPVISRAALRFSFGIMLLVFCQPEIEAFFLDPVILVSRRRLIAQCSHQKHDFSLG